jgi:hypothetical protein
MLVMVRAALPVFPSDIVMVAAEEPTTVLGKVNGFGLSTA